MPEVLKAWIWETYCELLPRGPGWKQFAQQLGVGGGGGGYIRSLTANLREPKSLYLSTPESAKGLRTGGRRAARFNQPATRLAYNPDLQICKHRFHASWFVQSSVKFRARQFLVHREITVARSKTNGWWGLFQRAVFPLYVAIVALWVSTVPQL